MIKTHLFIQLTLIPLLLLLSSKSSAQYSVEGLDVRNPHKWYDNQIGYDHSGILQGEYREIVFFTKNSDQFFNSPVWEANTISFRNEVYDSIFMLYDIDEDVLMIRHPTDVSYFGMGITLPQSDISWFTLSGHYFKNYSDPILNLGKGFFEESYLGDKMSLIIKRSKSLKTDRVLEFEDTHAYVIKLDESYHRFTGKSTFYRILPEYKKEIKQFLKDRRINLRMKDSEEGLLKTIKYCDLLLAQSSK
ncbi:MAG: hypothetical protein JXR10_17145 [Cyclobacteriaceae bacterium]